MNSPAIHPIDAEDQLLVELVKEFTGSLHAGDSLAPGRPH